jgi:hypothetical protein
MTHDGRALRILVVINEYTRECLALRVARRLGSLQVIETSADVMLVRGIPEHIRSDHGPELIAEELRKWLGKLGTKTLYIELGSPWENFNCYRYGETSAQADLRPDCRRIPSTSNFSPHLLSNRLIPFAGYRHCEITS